MKTVIPVLTAVLCLPADALRAGDIYKCEHQGSVIYSHLPCEPGAQPIELPALGRLGSVSDFDALQRRVDGLKQVGGSAEVRRPASSRRSGLGFGERTALKKLRIRADGLRRDLGNWHRHSSYRGSLEAELDDVEAEIRRLERKK